MSFIVYGIPTCGTVKKARAWLDNAGVPYTFVDFRKDPPSAAAVARWVEAFGSKAMRNTSGGAYRALGPERDAWSEAEWARHFHADPMLIKRPILTDGEAPISVGFSEASYSERVPQ